MKLIMPFILLGVFIALFITNNKQKRTADENGQDPWELIPDNPKLTYAYLAYKRGNITYADLEAIKKECAEEDKNKIKTDFKKLERKQDDSKDEAADAIEDQTPIEEVEAEQISDGDIEEIDAELK